MQSALVELLPYFIHRYFFELSMHMIYNSIRSFGNEARLDYGTGHEASFVAFLACLSKIGFLKRSDQASSVMCVFKKYAEVTRHVQRKFRGASQFIFSQQVVPGAILEEQIDAYDTNYLFLSSISFVRKVRFNRASECKLNSSA
ncbi:unnamed protein product [Bathycoccus prasinos]